ncbi:MAG: ATP-binding cassette domain-containing protein [Rhodobacterales bacterium]|nr:ATP-binding cassette domain-containing protein [Rhodobacterales bacterium]MDX5501278.1 ATP-binding cassette domain-containing protein [Rhodobacterales bacterium]
MIRLNDLSKSYDGAAVLADVTLDLPSGGVTAIIGPNGAGKSTLLSIIGRMLKADGGSAWLDDLDLFHAPGEQVARKLAILRQENHMTARLTVEELVSFGRYPHSRGRLTAEDRRHIARAIAYLGLEPLTDRFLDELSGGQRQRAAIAMVLAQDTGTLLLDEPLNNLDLRHAVAIMRLIRDAARDFGKTVVVVLHDINMAAHWCDRILVMKDGRAAHFGTPDQIMQPDLLSAVYGTPIDVHRIEGRIVAIY